MVRKMATSGSELSANVVQDLSASEDEADSDSAAEFIDPDSDCSENPPVQKKHKTSDRPKKATVCKFERSWSLPQHITSSSKGDTFAYCCLCSSHFSVSHGGFYDVKRHVSGSVHQ